MALVLNKDLSGSFGTTTNPFLSSVTNALKPAVTGVANVNNLLNTNGVKQPTTANANRGTASLPSSAPKTSNTATQNIAPYANAQAYAQANVQKQQDNALLNDVVNWGNQQVANGINPGTGQPIVEQPIAEQPTNNGGGSGSGVSAYEQAMLDAYNQRTALLEQNLNNSLAQLLNGYNFNADALNKSADNALREAYVNRMMNEKNLNQRLSMQGLNGGAAESTIAGLLNNYGNARNKIETERMSDLSNLLDTYQNNVAKAQQSYNDALVDAMPSYSNILTAQKSASTGGTKSASSTSGTNNTSVASTVAQRVAGGESLQNVMSELLAQNGGDKAAVMKILREAGLAS